MSSNSFSSINGAFIKKFKKDANVKVQTKLPSRVEADNAKAIAAGYSVIDATWFRRYMEEVKFDPVTHRHGVCTLFEMATACDCTPVGLIHFGRTTYGFKQFGNEEIKYLQQHMLADHDDDDVDDKSSGSYEEPTAAQPYPDNPTSEEAYAIDDDDEAAYEAARGKRKVRSGEEEDED